LEAITTYGFRGEALSSLSYVSILKITSKPKEQDTAYEAWYKMGKIVGAEGNEKAEAVPRRCEGENGTTICAKEMFYSVPDRKRVFNTTSEYFKVLSVIRKYSMHLPNIQFVCKKIGNRIADYISGIKTRQEIIEGLYGKKAVKNLLEVSFKKPDIFLTKVYGLISKPTEPTNKVITVIFINGTSLSSNKNREIGEE